MKHSISPLDYKTQQIDIATDYESKKLDELQESINQKETEYNERVNKIKSYDPGFGAYMKGVCKTIGKAIFFIAVFMGIVIPIIAILSSTDFDIPVKALLCIGGAIFGAIGGAIAGVIAGFIGGFVYGGILGVLFCPIAYPIYRSVCNKKAHQADIMLEEIDIETENNVEQLKQSILDNISENYSNTENKIMQYKEAFEQEAEELSVSFANSIFVQEVAQSLSTSFAETIKSHDRPSHIEEIIIPFDFEVGTDQICWNNEEYNFEEHRCEKIENVLKQTALAMAISTQIKSNIMTRSNKDTADIECKVDVSYDYLQTEEESCEEGEETKEYVSANLVYTASNGNFKPIQQW